MDSAAAALVNGALLGSTYALVSLGLVLVFRATYTFNFAHGEFMLLPALLLAVFLAGTQLPFVVAMILSLLIVAAVAAAFYSVILRHTVGLPHWMGLVATFGVASILQGAMSIIFGSSERVISIPGMPAGSVEILGTRVRVSTLVITLIALALALAVVAVMRWSHLGTLLRAAGQDPTLAAQGGIRVGWAYMGSWAAAGVLAGTAGILYASTQVVNASLIVVALSAFPAILLGGADSVEGAVVGGLLVGVLQGFITTYLGGQYLNVGTYLVLLAVLMAYPQGLFGTRTVRQV
ncbi:branched-chain amino acid ABC transporter permease [Nocardia rhamnosiphila]|uniref:Branched-chain amino acid ABC transporter permease n=1 Tax=Nocardia rhamnosiphila TaxID=426716 RepID=A0ABV2WYS2_9NOCA